MMNRKRIISLLCLALVISAVCAFAADLMAFRNSDLPETIIENESAVFTDGHEAFGEYGCEIIEKKVHITGPDPQFVVNAVSDPVSVIRILFSEPVTQDIYLQIFYAPVGGGFSEGDSIRTVIPSGSEEAVLSIQENAYAMLRFDFEQDVSLYAIYSGKGIRREDYGYRPNALRLVLLFVEVFIPLCALIFFVSRKSKQKEDQANATGRKKPLLTILFCNLFFSLTIVFFQPMAHVLANLGKYEYLFEHIRWIQLLLTAGAALVITGLMLFLPSRAGRIAASLSLSAGCAFLAQSLLLNAGKPLAMDTSWPMEMLNLFIWFGMILITVVMVIFYSETHSKKTETVMCIVACLLIVLQCMSYTVQRMITTEEAYRAEKNTRQAEKQDGLSDMEKGVIRISLFRGMPFFLKTAAAEEAVPYTGWELTQYPDASGNVGLFYSLYNPADGTLVLVDSGNPENADTVRQVIDSHGGHVTAWFLTHYHGDHIGAFNAVYEQYKDQIDVIYVNPLDWDTFEPIYHDWDTPEAFSGFLEMTKDAKNVVTLYAGNELGIDGLKIKVFSSFDEHVRELSTDWPNDSSIVFKVSAQEESVLFMGDLSRAAKPLGQYIIDTYGADEVHADYIQAGHHGNWGQPISFYEQLKPRVIFQDCPEWVFGDTYDAKDLKAWCEENGIETFDYRDTPVTVILY